MYEALHKRKNQKPDSRSTECRLIGYAASTQDILYQVDVGKTTGGESDP
jgi:hypothetical protein